MQLCKIWTFFLEICFLQLSAYSTLRVTLYNILYCQFVIILWIQKTRMYVCVYICIYIFGFWIHVEHFYEKHYLA